MDAGLFAKMLSDKSIIDLTKPGYKYPQADLKKFVALLDSVFYKPLPLKDFNTETVIASSIKLQNGPKKRLPKPADSGRRYSLYILCMTAWNRCVTISSNQAYKNRL